MLKIASALAVIGSLAAPVAALAQTVTIPVVRIPATVTGTWVLNPRACPDIREDIRDSRYTTSLRDLREDRRDQRVINCPPRAYSFVPDAGQAPDRKIRIDRYGNARFIDRNRGLPRGGTTTYNYVPVTPTPTPNYNTGTTTYVPYNSGTTVQSGPTYVPYNSGTTTYGGSTTYVPYNSGTSTYTGSGGYVIDNGTINY